MSDADQKYLEIPFDYLAGDEELNTMAALDYVMEYHNGNDEAAKQRIVNWFKSRFGQED